MKKIEPLYSQEILKEASLMLNGSKIILTKKEEKEEVLGYIQTHLYYMDKASPIIPEARAHFLRVFKKNY